MMTNPSWVGQVRNTLKRRTTHDSLVTAGSNLAISVLSVVGGVLAARLLGPEGRGELAAALVWAGILGTVAQLGLPQALTYFTARHTDSVGAIFRAMLFLFVLQSIGILLVGWLAVDLVLQRAQPTAVVTVRSYLFSIPLTILITYMGTIAQGLKQFGVFGALRVGSSVSYVLALGLAFLFQFHVALQVVFVLLAAQFITAVCSFIWFYFRLRPDGRFEWLWVRNLLGYGLKSYGGSLSWIANARMDQFVMSAYTSLENLGYYAVAVSYAGTLFPVLGATAMVLFPNVAGGSRETAGRKIGVALRLNLLISCIGTIILGSLSWFAVPFLFGVDYAPAIVPAVILLGGTILLGANYVLSDGLRGLGYPLIPSLGEIAGLVVTLIALYLWLPRFGIWGAVWASVLSYGVTSIVLGIGISQALNRYREHPSRSVS